MNKSELIQIIKEELNSILSDGAKLSADDPNNLHGDDRTQRQFVIDLAKSNRNIISISDISRALGVTNAEIYNTYSRLIRKYSNKENEFQVIIPGQPFRYEAIYEYVGSDKSDDEKPSKEELIKVGSELYKAAQTVYYSINRHDPKLGSRPVAFLGLRADEDARPYASMLPKESGYELRGIGDPETGTINKKWKVFFADKFKEKCEQLKNHEKVKFEFVEEDSI
jgi:hypothetical protein